MKPLTCKEVFEGRPMHEIVFVVVTLTIWAIIQVIAFSVIAAAFVE